MGNQLGRMQMGSWEMVAAPPPLHSCLMTSKTRGHHLIRKMVTVSFLWGLDRLPGMRSPPGKASMGSLQIASSCRLRFSGCQP